MEDRVEDNMVEMTLSEKPRCLSSGFSTSMQSDGTCVTMDDVVGPGREDLPGEEFSKGGELTIIEGLDTRVTLASLGQLGPLSPCIALLV